MAENNDKTNTNLAKRMQTIDEKQILENYNPRINKLLGDFSDLAQDNRYRHMGLVFVYPPINTSNAPINNTQVPIEVNVSVSPDPIFKAAANTRRPLSCIDTIGTIMKQAYLNPNIPSLVKQIIPGTNRQKKQRKSITTYPKNVKKKNIEREIVNFKRKIEEETGPDTKNARIKIEEDSDTDIDLLGGRGKPSNQIQKNTYKYKKNIKTRKHKNIRIKKNVKQEQEE